MQIVNATVATVMLFSAPVAPSVSHVVRAAPVTPHVQVVPVKPKAAPRLVCPGWMVFYPGEKLAFPIGSTVLAQELVVGPPDFIVFEQWITAGEGTTIMTPLLLPRCPTD